MFTAHHGLACGCAHVITDANLKQLLDETPPAGRVVAVGSLRLDLGSKNAKMPKKVSP